MDIDDERGLSKEHAGEKNPLFPFSWILAGLRPESQRIRGGATAVVPSETNDTARDAKQGGRGLFLLPGAQENTDLDTRELPGDSKTAGFLVTQSRRGNPTIIPITIIPILTPDKHLLRACSCEPANRLLAASELPTVAKVPAGSMKPELLSTLTFK